MMKKRITICFIILLCSIYLLPYKSYADNTTQTETVQHDQDSEDTGDDEDIGDEIVEQDADTEEENEPEETAIIQPTSVSPSPTPSIEENTITSQKTTNTTNNTKKIPYTGTKENLIIVGIAILLIYLGFVLYKIRKLKGI